MHADAPEPLQIDVRTAAKMIGIGKSFLYELMNNPAAFPIRPVRIGSKVLFNRRQLVKWIELGCPRTSEGLDEMQKAKR